MKQLITRVPDDVLDACKRKAKAEGVSMNTFVNRLLAQAAAADEAGAELDRRLAEAGIRVVYPTLTRVPPTMEEIWAMTAGSGTAILDELLADRHRVR
ncbi:MAG: hypothetical protein U0869_23860 [Chloroflexota bacterium]